MQLTGDITNELQQSGFNSHVYIFQFGFEFEITLLYLPGNGPRNPYSGERMTDEFESREIPDFTISTSTILGRIYEGKWWDVERWKHQIEPEISYTYILRVDQNDLPFFDDLDRIGYTNAVTYGLTNTVSGKIRQTGGGYTIRDLLRFTVSQSYSFGEPFWREQKGGRGRYLSDIDGELWLNPSQYINVRGDLQYNPYKRHLDGFNVYTALSDRRGDALGFEYRYSRDEVENINANLNVRIQEWLDLFSAYSYNIFEKRRISSVYGLDFRSKCWGIRFSVEDKKRSPLTIRDGVPTRLVEDEIDFRVQVTLTGVGSVGLR